MRSPLVVLVAATALAGCSKRALVFPDPTGAVATLTTAPRFDLENPFFKPLGTNGRACVTCHAPSDGWTISAAHVRERFEATGGTDPLFASVDGTNSPRADRSTVAARRTASSLLLERGVIRVGLPVPANAEFELAAVDDPYGFASAGELSLFRRPLPATNLRFLTTVMVDGRETFDGEDLRFDLEHQALDATMGHAQAVTPPTPDELAAIVDFELSTSTAQVADAKAGILFEEGARGGPLALVDQAFFVGINDPLSGHPFDATAMTLFERWRSSRAGPFAAARASIARGEELFDGRAFVVSGVGGLNDLPGVGPRLSATCTTCHDSPNVGNHSVPLALDIGVTTAARRSPAVPLYTLRNRATGECLQTTDPGRALITGRWRDVSRFKGPILRGVAARAPYFHDGSAASLEDVVEFYDGRFEIGLTDEEKADLVAFLRSL